MFWYAQGQRGPRGGSHRRWRRERRRYNLSRRAERAYLGMTLGYLVKEDPALWAEHLELHREWWPQWGTKPR